MKFFNKVPWMVTVYVGLVLLVVIVIVVVKIVQSVNGAKQRFDSVKPLTETKDQVPVSYVYSYVDALLRAAQQAAYDSESANKRGMTYEASAFGFAAIAYIQCAVAIAPKRVKSIFPDAEAVLEQLNNVSAQHVRGRLEKIQMINGPDEPFRVK